MASSTPRTRTPPATPTPIPILSAGLVELPVGVGAAEVIDEVVDPGVGDGEELSRLDALLLEGAVGAEVGGESNEGAGSRPAKEL